MENSNMENKHFPEEIKAESENTNPLLDIISNIQEKLESSNQNNQDNQKINKQNTYNNSEQNFTNMNNRILYLK